MPTIGEYLEDIERLINDLPFKLSARFQVENRGNAVLYFKGVIVFIDSSELHFKEYFLTIPVWHKLAYSYHYQNREKELIFRFDNAEHYSGVETFPHHKHLKDKVLPSKEPSLKEVLREIISRLSKS